MSMTSSTNYSASKDQPLPMKKKNDIFEIEQCLYPLPEEFFLREEKVESISPTISSISEIAPPLANWEDLCRGGLSQEIIDKLCFTEMLLISANDDENVVGGLAIQVELIADEVIAVFCSSGFSLDEDRLAGYELLALTDKRFQPFQERRSEAVMEGDLKQEKQMQLYFGEDMKVTAFRQVSTSEGNQCFEGILDPIEDQGILIPDGLNMLLMRYLVITNFVGELHVRTINIEGQIGNCVYQISEPIVTKIGEEIHNTIEIIRTIYYPDVSEPETSISYYLQTGHLLRHTWNNSSYSIIMNPKTGIPDPALNTDRLYIAMRTYLQELADFLDGTPGDARRWSTLLPRPSEIVQDVLSEILLDVTRNASAFALLALPNTNSSADTAREILIEIVEQMSIGV